VLVVDDEESMCEFLEVALTREGYIVETVTDPIKVVEGELGWDFDVAIVDIKMPRLSGLDVLRALKENNKDIAVIMITAYASVESAVAAMKEGAYDYIMKPFKLDEVRIIIKKALERKLLVEENRQLQSIFKTQEGFGNLIGKSEKMRELYEKIKKVAPTNSTVLICGESGTGKELVARAIHYNSLRAGGPFVAVDCTALPETLLESELFGHVKGAFTGAVADKKGLFEVADGGTIFLDEVGDISPAIQAKLLRVLQERAFKPVGGTKTIQVDVRVVAATNKNLEELVRKGSFREDLYYRLSVIPLYIPPLREREGDIPLLARHFVRKYAEENGKEVEGISDEALRLLVQYPWPGNVRELENVIEQAVTLATGSLITPEDLPEHIKSGRIEHLANNITLQGTLKDTIETLEKELILKALREAGGNQYRAAKRLGLSRQNLQYKIRKYGILCKRETSTKNFAGEKIF